MKKGIKSVFLILLSLLIVVFPLSGCKKAGDKISEEIGESLTEKYLEGLTGGNADLDIEEGKWPKDMPAKVPEFKKGKIDSSSSITVSGQTQMSILINEVKEKDYNEYIQKLLSSGFVSAMEANYNGIISGSYTNGNNYMSLTLDVETEELIISYSGKE